MEVAPGIERIESVLGPRPFAQYLVRGERSLLVDTGTAKTPGAVILPAFAACGLDPNDLDWVVITHADVDHYGGGAAIRAAAPPARFCAHRMDVPWLEDRDRIFRERYGWYAAHGVDYDADTTAWLRAAAPNAVLIDLALNGGERFRLGPRLTVDVLHLPGHSPGHIGLWEPESRSAIITDAALGAGLLDHTGAIISPPPYYDVMAYTQTIQLLRALHPVRLLTAHYAVIEGDAVTQFLDASAAFVERTRQATRAAFAAYDTLTLKDALPLVDSAVGPFPVMGVELAGSVYAHLRDLEAAGIITPTAGSVPTAWQRIDILD